MKKFIVLSLFVLSINAFSKTIIYSYYGTDKTDGVNFFYASSFGKNVNYCYDGLPEEVCSEVKVGVAIVERAYAEGAHDYFKVVSCARDHDQVTVKSQLFDDYDADGDALAAVLGMCE